MNKPIRILQVFAKMNRGGAETMILNLYRNIDRSKVQFDFIVHTEEKCAYDDEIMDLGGKIHRVPQYTLKNHIEYKNAWKKILECNKEYNVIHSHVRSTAAIYLKMAKKYGLITIAHSHNTSSGKGFRAIAKNIMQKSIKDSADYLFACSMNAGVWLFGRESCKKNNFYILNNAIESSKFTYNEKTRNQMRSSLYLNGKFVVGHVGRFHPQKNHTFLLEIFKEVYKKDNTATLMLVGDGELRDAIKRKTIEIGIDESVLFLGVRSDIPELFQAMDVFVFPSLYEGLGIVAIEAQASGLKTFSSSEVVPEEVKITELLEFIPLSKQASFWADKILESRNNYIREDTNKKIVDAKYDINDTSKWLEKFYLEL